ncbi:hypothetical protein [Pseudactinotalea suaedae]|uniref:hypothetical protein n=1 Tax=Pseudactinotalea suaedae TaxID=1524924 RepID=UPI0012E29679|nr:hypothetical protein [Pseudactinotalea suaedae]
MSARGGRRRRVDAAYVTKRAQTARTFHAAAGLAAEESDWHQAAAALFVLAGIAAADTICGKELGQISRGQDHRQATALLSEVKDTERAVAALANLLEVKDEAHYSFTVTAQEFTRARRSAQTLLDAMESRLLR